MLGEIEHFTGISDVYEPPDDAEIEVRMDLETPKESKNNIISWLFENEL